MNRVRIKIEFHRFFTRLANSNILFRLLFSKAQYLFRPPMIIILGIVDFLRKRLPYALYR